MVLGFLHSPLDHTFTGELKTRDYQYLGEFKYWMPHGEGKKIFSKTYHNGHYVSYDGGFRLNEYKGFGTLILWDGTEYVGGIWRCTFTCTSEAPSSPNAH